MGSEYIGNGYGQSRAGGCVGGVGCLADEIGRAHV